MGMIEPARTRIAFAIVFVAIVTFVFIGDGVRAALGATLCLLARGL
jgi:hypothetical protein